MFAKLCNWVLMGSLAGVLSACGGGEPDSALETAPSAQYAATPNAEAHGAAAMAGQAFSAVGMDAQQQAHAPQQGADGQVAFQAELQVVSMHGSSAYAIGNGARARLAQSARALETRQTDPELADDDARDRMALNEVEFEKSFSLEKNRELAEHKMREGVVEPVEQQVYVPHEDCVDPRLPECAANPQLARY